MAATKKIEDGFLIHEIKTVVAMTVDPPVMMWTLNDAWSQKSDMGCELAIITATINGKA
jgi:hypothetical protein